MSVNVWTPGSRRAKGGRYKLDVTIQWTDSSGMHTHSEVVRFPQILESMPEEWVRERLTDLAMEALRLKLGID